MPVLKSARHKKFAQALSEGKTIGQMECTCPAGYSV